MRMAVRCLIHAYQQIRTVLHIVLNTVIPIECGAREELMLMAATDPSHVNGKVTGNVAHIAQSTAMITKCFAPEDKMSMAVQNLISAYQSILNVPHIVR